MVEYETPPPPPPPDSGRGVAAFTLGLAAWGVLISRAAFPVSIAPAPPGIPLLIDIFPLLAPPLGLFLAMKGRDALLARAAVKLNLFSSLIITLLYLAPRL